ncbi:MAG: TolC family protein [Proteobacteria bacterium]|nr:TolC family protein [Pseudomonadota bacterium]
MKIKLLLIILICWTKAAQASSDPKAHLSQQEVVSSAQKNYPKILSYYEKVSAAEGTALASLGFFDIKLKHQFSDRTRGFYDGKISNTSLEKELGFFGAKVYGGYRKSSGSFPDYEGGSFTNSGGEYRGGARFSLLKDSSIDPNRLGVILSNLELQESKIQLETIKKEIARDATKAYWKWVAAAKVFHIYDELYQLSLRRQSQLEERLKKGDVAEIVVIENKKNILRRKSALANARQNFENSAIYLSLFWRSNNGEPLIPKESQAPKISLNLHPIKAEEISRDVESALTNRPEIRILKIQKEQNLNQLKYAENLFKPQLDVDIGASKDLGEGPRSRSKANNYLGLDFSIPLQQREARGKSSEYQSKLKSLKHEQQLAEEKIKAEIEQIKIQIDGSIEMHHNLSEEVKLSELLESSEREKFKQGTSNFFLVNLREQDTAASKASAIEMFEKYQSFLADYKMAIFLE